VLYRNIQHSTMPTRTCSPPWRRAPRHCALRLALRRRTFAGQVTRSQPRARAPLRTAHANLARVLTLPGVGETGPNAHWPCWAIEWGRKATKELRLLNCYRIFVLASFSYTIHVYTLTIHIKFFWQNVFFKKFWQKNRYSTKYPWTEVGFPHEWLIAWVLESTILSVSEWLLGQVLEWLRLRAWEHLQQYYLKHTSYFSIQEATYFETTHILLPTPAILPKPYYSNSFQ
jgi:hypothetical protein